MLVDYEMLHNRLLKNPVESACSSSLEWFEAEAINRKRATFDAAAVPC
jgi:hypothetical protein